MSNPGAPVEPSGLLITESASNPWFAKFRPRFYAAIEAELARAYAKHGAPTWGRHEFYAILKEEVDELWDAIKDDRPQGDVFHELVQVAAMCFRYYETGDRYRGPMAD
jgi:hypothetical protein